MTVATEYSIELFRRQREFVDDDKPYTAAVCGIGGGKTRAGAAKLLMYLSEHKGALAMVTAPTFPMLRDATLRTIYEVFPRPLIREMHTGDMRMELVNGSEILFRSTDDPDRLRGPNLAAIWMDEAAQSKAESFKVLQGRLRQTGYPHRLWITTTPKGYNWLYQEFACQQRPDYSLHSWATRENPYLPDTYVRQLQESYAEDFALQELGGKFVLVGGTGFFGQQSVLDLLDSCEEPRETRLGLVKVWKRPTVAGKYVAFGDVAWGEKGAYTCVVIADYQTGDQMAEIYGRPDHDELARVIYDTCGEYNKAFLGIEANGEGINVVNKLIDLGYGDRMYHRDSNWRQEPKKRGYWTDKFSRPDMLGQLAEAVSKGQIRPRCKDAIDEMMSFIRDEKGRPGPAEGAYADHVMAWAGLLAIRGSARYGVAYSGAPLMVPSSY